MRIPGKARGLSAVVVLVASFVGAATAYATPGDLDTSYGLGTGASRPGFGTNDDAHGVALEPNGTIVVVGTEFPSYAFAPRIMAMRFLNPQGTLDPSFGDGGSGRSLPFPQQDISGDAIAIQPDGAILAAGTFSGTNTSDMWVTRLRASDGLLDPGYGLGTGASRVDFGGDDDGNAIALQPDGKIVVGGTGTGLGGDSELLVARLLDPAGTFDTSYGAGTAGSRPQIAGSQHGNAVALQADGKILIAGTTLPGTPSANFIVARFLVPSGGGDPSFGQGATFSVMDMGADDTLSGMVLQPDGKIVLAGTTGSATATGDFAVARLNPDGLPDNTFGQGGKMIVDLGGDDSANAVALQPDGKILVTGGTQTGSVEDIATVRLQPNGQLDSTFGKGGKSIVDLGQNEDARAIALQADGKIVLAGESKAGTGPYSVLVVRLLGDPASSGGGSTGGTGGTGGGGTTPTGPGAPATIRLCDGRKATIIGTNGADHLIGTRGADVIVSLGGNDTIKTLGGNDVVCAGDGNDHIDGDAGADRIFGQAGNDTIAGGAGGDTINGGAGSDKLAGQAGNDKIAGGPGSDTIAGGPGADTLAGQAGNDRITGGAGRDTISGGAGKNSTTA